MRNSNLNLSIDVTHDGVDLPEAGEIAGFIARAVAARYGIGPHLHAGNVPVKVKGRVTSAGKGANTVNVTLISGSITGPTAKVESDLGRKAAARLAARKAKAAKPKAAKPKASTKPALRKQDGTEVFTGKAEQVAAREAAVATPVADKIAARKAVKKAA